MKKILSIMLAAMLAVGVSAKEYKHSIGLVGGLGLGAQYKTMVTNHFTILAETGYFMNLDGGTGFGYMGGLGQAVFAYQAKVTEGQGIKLDWYTGGQIKLGVTNGGGAGIFGFGGAVGLEANMINAPIAFSLDFRPGYAFMFNGGGAGGHMFDYSFNLGVRYTL